MEHQFHNWLKSQLNQTESAQHVLVGVGDDAAVLSGTDMTSVIATDTIADGTHFELSKHSLELIGRKALAVNLSDLAAMGSQPVAALLSFLLPRKFKTESDDTLRDFGLAEAQQLFQGVAELAKEFNVAIIGGDTNSWDGPLVVGVTVIGHRDPRQTGWGMDGVQPGDSIVASGSFGGSIHGRHFSFTPRIALANYLSKNYDIHGATDASDSLSLDLSNLAKASGVGIDFATEAIPISPDVRETDPARALHHALTDGEDFELILAVPQTQIADLMADPKVPCELTVLGAATDLHQELQTLDENGNSVTYTPQGYVH